MDLRHWQEAGRLISTFPRLGRARASPSKNICGSDTFQILTSSAGNPET